MSFKEYIESLINEFNENENWFTDWNEALLSENIEMACYDVGRYEVLMEIRNKIEKGEIC